MENNDKELDVFRASDGHLYVLLVDYLVLKFEFDKLKVLLQEKENEKNELYD
jgi:hypothetical protein